MIIADMGITVPHARPPAVHAKPHNSHLYTYGKWHYLSTPWDEKVRKCIMWRESNNLNLKPNYASASGYYQFIDSAWKHFAGKAHAYQASYAVQTIRFWMVWKHGDGKNQWNYPPNQCW